MDARGVAHDRPARAARDAFTDTNAFFAHRARHRITVFVIHPSTMTNAVEPSGQRPKKLSGQASSTSHRDRRAIARRRVARVGQGHDFSAQRLAPSPLPGQINPCVATIFATRDARGPIPIAMRTKT